MGDIAELPALYFGLFLSRLSAGTTGANVLAQDVIDELIKRGIV